MFLKVTSDFTFMHILTSILGENSILKLSLIWSLEILWLCRVVTLKSLPVHSFNALIIPVLRGCLQSLFNIPVP